MSTSTELSLKLKGKSPLRRELFLVAGGGHLSAALYALRSKRNQFSSLPMLAWASAEIACSRLLIRKDGRFALWVGSAAFDVSATEAQQIRAMYEPLGLRIEEETAYERDIDDADVADQLADESTELTERQIYSNGLVGIAP